MPTEESSRTTEPTGRARNVRVWAYIGAVSIGAVLFSALLWGKASPFRIHEAVPWPLIALAFMVASAYPVGFHFKRQTVMADLVGLAILMGVVTGSPRDVLIARIVARLVLLPQNGRRLDRAVFNLVSSVFSLGASLIVLEVLVNGMTNLGPPAWPALVLVLLVDEVVSAGLVFGVVTISQGAPPLSYLQAVVATVAVVLPINAALGIGVATVAWAQPWAVLPLAGPGILLAAWYRRADKIRSRYADLQKLYGFTLKLSEQSGARELLAVALAEARTVLRAQKVAAYLPARSGMVFYEIGPEGELSISRKKLPAAFGPVAEARQSILVRRGRHPHVTWETGYSDLVAAPVEIGEEHVGVLVLADREGSRSTFDEDDRLLVEALGANLGTALTSARRHDELQEARIRREYELRHDDLTGLPNRSEFARQLAHALGKRRPAELLAVVLMDLDGFKEINDTVGHDIGDLVLQETARRLRGLGGGGRLVARLGGDEFALLVPGVVSVEAIVKTAEAALAAVSKPIREKGLVLDLRASVGVGIVPLHLEEPLKCAEIAMYEAKRSHGGIVTYDQAIDHNTTRKLLLATELRRAMSEDKLEVYYQPVADLRSGEIRGFEALLRWRHQQYGSVSPSEFVPVAERTGLIGELTWWVLEKALAELRGWQDQGYEFTMAVNLSARSLMDADLVGRLRQMIEDAGVRPRSLMLEITETSIMVDSERSERVLNELARLGIEIAVDDYGTEYSSLSRLQRLPVTTVKIDRSFVMNMCANDRDEKIVRATIFLAHTLGQRVIAEGVEDLATWKRLSELGCDEVQGYYLSAPVPAEQCRLWVKSRQPAKLAPVRHLRPVAGA